MLWTSQRDAKLGTATDSDLAGRWGCSPSCVRRRRQRLGIKPVKPRRVHWTAKALRKLATTSTRKLAAEMGCSHMTVSRRRRACVRAARHNA